MVTYCTFYIMSLSMEETYLLEALVQAHKGKGFCAPNPSVGAVVVKNQEIIARGYHSAFGAPHAEVQALKNLTEEVCQGSTLYLTLEPCCHWGKTPPCTELILKKKIKKVIYALRDPNPEVNGQSVAWLNKEGIACELVEVPEIKEFYESYLYWQKFKKPYFTAKIALSLDGKIALEHGDPVAITRALANELTHTHRKHTDAILTTVKTIMSDDPQLNARSQSGIIKKRLFIIDRALQFPLSARVMKTAEEITLFYDRQLENSNEALERLVQQGIKLVPIHSEGRFLDFREISAYLGELGLHDIWIEAGGQLTEYLLLNGYLQKLLCYIAPKILGEKAYSAFRQPFDFYNVTSIKWDMLEPDVVCTVKW